MQEDRIISYHIAYVLPLQLNTSVDVLTQLNENEEMVRQLVLTEQECRILRTLLDASPGSCATEDVLGAMNADEASISGVTLLTGGDLDCVLGPFRNILSTLQTKIEPFGLTIRTAETGYLITSIHTERRA